MKALDAFMLVSFLLQSPVTLAVCPFLLFVSSDPCSPLLSLSLTFLYWPFLRSFPLLLPPNFLEVIPSMNPYDEFPLFIYHM